jgi:hypothetical protein
VGFQIDTETQVPSVTEKARDSKPTIALVFGLTTDDCHCSLRRIAGMLPVGKFGSRYPRFVYTVLVRATTKTI